jgi:type IV pilus assembly protein PilM
LGSIVSLDIGKKVKAVEGTFTKGSLQIDKAVTFEVPDSSFNGELIAGPELLSESIRMALHNAGITTKEAIVTINANSSVIRDLELPGAKPNETAEMIKSEMIQTYHILPTDVIQYKKIEKAKEDSDSPLFHYRAAALDQEFVESYYKLLVDCKLKPVAMDINVNAIDKLLTGELIVNDKLLNGNGTMFLDFGDSLTTVYIVASGRPIFFRHLDFGSGDIERIISGEIYTPEEDIRRMKEDGYDFFENDEDQKYVNILKPYLYNLTDEIRKVIGFYTSRSNSGNIDQIYLFGGGSFMKGFAKYCENHFGVPAEQLVKISKLKLRDTEMPIAFYLNAIGALIRY